MGSDNEIIELDSSQSAMVFGSNGSLTLYLTDDEEHGDGVYLISMYSALLAGENFPADLKEERDRILSDMTGWYERVMKEPYKGKEDKDEEAGLQV